MPFFMPDDKFYDFLLVDGQHMVHRAAHAYGELDFVNEHGTVVPTGIIYGFLKMTTRAWRSHADAGCRVIICWEGGYKHRTALYPAYKANRREAPINEEKQEYLDNLFSQQRALRRILRVAGWAQAVAPGYEADDSLAALAHLHGDKKVAIYTGDQDLHQCVTERTHVISAVPGSGNRDKVWKIEDVREKWGVSPLRVPEAKAFAGDSGDNIPGCPGCGLGWAKKLLSASETVEEILAKAEAGVLKGEYNGKAWKAKKLTEKVRENAAQIRISHELAKVVRDAPVEIDHGERDIAKFRQILEALRMHSLVDGKNWQSLTEVR